MKNKGSEGLEVGPIEKFKKKGMNGMLKSYEGKLPHEQIFADLAKPVPPACKFDKKHIKKVVGKMNSLLKPRLGDVLDLNPKSKGSIPFERVGPLEEIIKKLDEREKHLLLYTALYHDIGKAINRPRHGPEGADVIKDSGLEERKKFYGLGFKRPDFFFMSNLIRFHDYLGMMQTGETSYLTFVEVLYPVTNIGIAKNEKFLEYLLIVSLADIAGSIPEKIDNEKFSILLNDFNVLKRAHDNSSKKVYRDIFIKEPPADMGKVHKATVSVREIADVIPQLLAASENSASERLRRLLRASLKRVAVDDSYINWINKYGEAKKVSDWFTWDEEEIDITPVIASLRALNIEKDFCTKLAFICKLDYALGFTGGLIKEMIEIEVEKSEELKKSPHDMRRNVAMSVIDLIKTLVDLFGDFTLNDVRIGLGFERLGEISEKQRRILLRRLSGENGSFKRAEALTKFRDSVNMWVIAP